MSELAFTGRIISDLAFTYRIMGLALTGRIISDLAVGDLVIYDLALNIPETDHNFDHDLDHR